MQKKIKNLFNKLMYEYKMMFVIYPLQYFFMLPSYLHEPPIERKTVYDCSNHVYTDIINVNNMQRYIWDTNGMYVQKHESI